MSRQVEVAGSAAVAAITLFLAPATVVAQPPEVPIREPGATVPAGREDFVGAVQTDEKSLGVARIHDRYGDLVRRETRRVGGEPLVEHFLYDSTGAEIGRAQQLTEDAFHSYLRRLGLGQATAAASAAESAAQRSKSELPWGSVVSEKTADGDETRIDVFGQRMKVTRISGSDGEVRIEDDWGGIRTDVHRSLPFFRENHGVRHGRGVVHVKDGLGTVAEVVVDGEGNPREVHYADNLLVRYHYRADDLQSAPSIGAALNRVWLELVDLRTGITVLDSRLVPNELRRTFRLGRVGATYVEASVDERLFATVDLAESGVYALLPLEDGEIWRRAVVGGTDLPLFRTEVDYRADLVRVTFTMPSFTVEIPRKATSEEPFRLLFPERLDLPLVDGGHVDSGVLEGVVVREKPESAFQLSANQQDESEPHDIGYMEVVNVVGQRWTIGIRRWHRPGRRQPGRQRRWAPGSQAVNRITQAALNQAKTRVERDTCRALFRADERAANPAGIAPGFWNDPSEILRAARYVVGGAFCTGDEPAYTRAFARGVQPVIHLCQPFFRTRSFPAGAGRTMSRAGVLIHEARHVTGRQHAPNDTSLSVADYNAAISGNCSA